MKTPHEPYRMDRFKLLMQRAYQMGWYPGKQDLLKVTMQGAFEGYSGRSTETWEQRFFVEFKKPAGDDETKYPERILTADAATLDEACQQILSQIAIAEV
jgi:hypothetical protein